MRHAWLFVWVRSSSFPLALGLALLLAATSVARAAELTAAQKNEAKAAYETGTKKYALGRYEEAAADFEKAYSISSQPAILFNMAQAYRLSGKTERALTLYKSYRSFDPESPFRDEVNKRITELQKIVDDQKANAAKAEAEEKRKREELERQKELERNRELAKQEAELKAKQALLGLEKAKPHPRLDIVGFALTGVGVACLAAGGALAGLAKGASDDITAAAKRGDVFTQALADKESQGKTFNTAGIALMAVGGVAVIGGVISIVVGLKWRKQDKERGLTSITPTVGTDSAGLVIGGRF